MMKKLAVAASMLFLAGCLNPNTMEITTSPLKLSKSETALVKTLVSETTRDPESVRFRFLTGYRASNGDTIICGEANAKNAYGGYVGYTPLWVRMDGTTLKSANFLPDFATNIAKACNEAKMGKTTIDPNA
jgi:hypothetical protein